MTTTTVFAPRINLNTLFAAVLSGGLAGVVIGGVLSRISMRVVALLTGSPGEFSVDGTLGILLIAAVFGVIFGGIYSPLRRFLPSRWPWQGAVYGGLWAVLVCYFFFANREGELGLIGPVTGAALFSPIPVVQGAGMAWLLGRVEARLAGRTVRTVPAHWFAGLIVAVLLAAVGMSSLAGEGLRLPPALFDATTRLGIAFAAVTNIHQLLGFLFILLWIGLCLVLFGLGSPSRRGGLTALGLLLLAAGLFHTQPPFAGQMAGIPVGPLLNAVLTGIGAASLVALVLSLPNRAFRRREIGLTGSVLLVVLLWQGTNLSKLPIQQPAWEWIVWMGALSVLGGTATTALWQSWRNPLIRLPALAWALAVACFLALWGATLLNSELNFRGIVHPFAPFGVTVYLLPWLLPPLALVLAARKVSWTDR